MNSSRRDFFKKSMAGALALGAASIPTACTASGVKAKRVLIITYDGICVEGFHKAKTPNVDALMAEGSLSIATRDVMPSITLPNYTSHLLGSGPEQHGVVNNGWTLAEHQLPAVETDEDGYYPSVFKVLKDQIPGIKTAMLIDWKNLFYPQNLKYIDDANCLEDYNSYPQHFDRAFNFMKENKNNPTFVFLYLVKTDEVGHTHGWMSPEYIKSIEDADVEVGKLIEKMKAEGMYDDTHIFFITDHGGIGHGHGGFTTDEMVVPWGLRGPGIKKGFKITEPNNTVNTASTVVRLFGAKQPDCWTGEVPESIFE